MKEPPPIARFVLGEGPIVAAAIHDGHAVRPEVAARLALGEAERLREEDPHTATWTEVVATRVVGLRSRFEVDLNRPREGAVYLTPEQAWGLVVWKQPPPDDFAERSRQLHDGFYAQLREILDEKVRRYGRFVLLDLHSYNHRRDGPAGPPADPVANPQINVGTATLGRRQPWAQLIERFMADFSARRRPDGSRYDVRENVKFKGGYLGRWVHETYRDSGCALSVEMKKFFMDEHTGDTFAAEIEAVRLALAATVPGLLDELEALAPGG